MALVSLLIVGTLFFRAARGIKEMEPWGKRTGQLAVVLLLSFVFGITLLVMPWKLLPFRGDLPSLMFSLIFVIAIGQLLLPAYFGFLYLGRLPVKEEGSPANRYRSASLSQIAALGVPPGAATSEAKYVDSPFPFGIAVTVAVSNGRVHHRASEESPQGGVQEGARSSPKAKTPARR